MLRNSTLIFLTTFACAAAQSSGQLSIASTQYAFANRAPASNAPDGAETRSTTDENEPDRVEPEPKWVKDTRVNRLRSQEEIEKYLANVIAEMSGERNANPDAFRLAVRPDGKPLVIAHRGASGYLPEHTLAAYAAAYFMGADVIEPDVVLTKDGVPICSHDVTLDETTDVAEKFPGRARENGKHYAIDFTLAEIKTLEKLGREGRVRMRGHTVPTLSEMIELVQTLNASTGGTVGIIPEPKQPLYHRESGQPIEEPLVSVLDSHGYTDRDHRCVIQCFDIESLETIRNDLDCDLSLAFLAADPIPANKLNRVANTCDAVGYKMVGKQEGYRNFSWIQSTSHEVKRIHDRGLGIYGWTFGSTGEDYDDSVDLHNAWMNGHIDGLFSDRPDLAREVLDLTIENGERREPSINPVVNP